MARVRGLETIVYGMVMSKVKQREIYDKSTKNKERKRRGKKNMQEERGKDSKGGYLDNEG